MSSYASQTTPTIASPAASGGKPKINIIDVLACYPVLRGVASYLTTDELRNLALSSVGLWECTNTTKTATLRGLTKLTTCDNRKHFERVLKERGLSGLFPTFVPKGNCRGLFDAKPCERCDAMVCKACRGTHDSLNLDQIDVSARELYMCDFCVENSCAYALSIDASKLCRCHPSRTARGRWHCIACAVKVCTDDVARLKCLSDHRMQKKPSVFIEPEYTHHEEYKAYRPQKAALLVHAGLRLRFQGYDEKALACECESKLDREGGVHCACCGLGTRKDDVAIVGCAWCGGQITKMSRCPPVFLKRD
ncbi:hypothetical protein BU16DRAFT_544498 [Lophium mytilinum]|uniref:Uncharacterized protein n=1 Tax=Lophium mytilinum TaxID=390894 RepID=A0A6A6QAI9_9PEZI|nr:hypothetical protein BU16DRAFT_544498 [Lophium mytilinum]